MQSHFAQFENIRADVPRLLKPVGAFVIQKYRLW